MTDAHGEAIADDDTLLRRAFAAYYRSGAREGFTPEQLNIPANDSYVTEHGGKFYVVLQNINGVLAVYRVRTSGVLKALRRWPKDIEQV
jgi:hypothetical protein